jgi:DUF971 family protein
MQPLKIKVIDGIKLYILWDDNVQNLIELKKLREICPCAFCNAKREEKKGNLIPIYNKSELTITDISIVGNYALKLTWEDGHNTGLYGYDMLRFNSDEYHNCHKNKEKIKI